VVRARGSYTERRREWRVALLSLSLSLFLTTKDRVAKERDGGSLAHAGERGERIAGGGGGGEARGDRRGEDDGGGGGGGGSPGVFRCSGVL